MSKAAQIPDDWLDSMGASEVCRGAEAVIYFGTWEGRPVVIKERRRREYRHPDLDRVLTRRRFRDEVRAFARVRKAIGDLCPHLVAQDELRGLIVMERVPGITMREALTRDAEPAQVIAWCDELGRTIARMHAENVVHGDLTTSNIMISADRSTLTIIDFGLATASTSVEDFAVDLHVFERTFVDCLDHDAEVFMAAFFGGYVAPQGGGTPKNAHGILTRLQKVRERGRKVLPAN